MTELPYGRRAEQTILSWLCSAHPCALEFIHPSDVLVATKLDRIALRRKAKETILSWLFSAHPCALEFIHPSDVLVATKLDRIALRERVWVNPKTDTR